MTWQVAGIHLSVLIPGVSEDAINLITVSNAHFWCLSSPSFIFLLSFSSVDVILWWKYRKNLSFNGQSYVLLFLIVQNLVALFVESKQEADSLGGPSTSFLPGGLLFGLIRYLNEDNFRNLIRKNVHWVWRFLRWLIMFIQFCRVAIMFLHLYVLKLLLPEHLLVSLHKIFSLFSLYFISKWIDH